MRANYWGPALSCLALLLCVSTAHADQVIYDNFTEPGEGFNKNLTGWYVSGSETADNYQEIAVPFTVGGASLDLSTITVAIGSYKQTTSYDLSIESSLNGAPSNTALESFNSLTPSGTHSNLTAETVDSVLKPKLSAGSTYWVVATPASGTTFDEWDLNSSGTTGFAYNQGVNWRSFGGTAPALRITGAPVPEATTLVSFSGLIAGGVLSMIQRRRRA